MGYVRAWPNVALAYQEPLQLLTADTCANSTDGGTRVAKGFQTWRKGRVGQTDKEKETDAQRKNGLEPASYQV